MEESSDFVSDKPCQASMNSDQTEDSGYSSNLSEFSESFRNLSPLNCTPLFRPSSTNSFLSSTVNKGPLLPPKYEASSFPESPNASSYFVKQGKRGSPCNDFECSFSADIPKKKRLHEDGKTNSARQISSTDVPGSTEPKYFSTPYTDFINKLKYSPSPGAKINLTGVTNVDFLYFLGVKSTHTPVLQKIFANLSDCDLYNASRVSKTWHNLIMSNEACRKRIRNFVCRPLKENILPRFQSLKLHENAELPGVLTSRIRLMEIGNRANVQIENLSSEANKSPPVSPSKVRFHLFQKEGRKLDPGEQLVQCPRCSLPSRQDKSKNLGLCTRQGCQHEFCLNCNCEYRPPHSCTMLTPRYSSKNSHMISSKASKRLLRRL